MTNEVLKKRLALIEVESIRVDRRSQKIVPGADPEVELRLEALIQFLEKSSHGIAQKGDESSKEAGNAESSSDNRSTRS
jgi:hypothetical protein